jgi:hypothetical protein
MTDQHPITPPPELVQPVGPTDEELDQLEEMLWDRYKTLGFQGEEFMYDHSFGFALADFARAVLARWGADQELEACCDWLIEHGYDIASPELRTSRRKPPTLKEQALKALEVEDDAMPLRSLERGERFDTIRRALEALPND